MKKIINTISIMKTITLIVDPYFLMGPIKFKWPNIIQFNLFFCSNTPRWGGTQNTDGAIDMLRTFQWHCLCFLVYVHAWTRALKIDGDPGLLAKELSCLMPRQCCIYIHLLGRGVSLAGRLLLLCKLEKHTFKLHSCKMAEGGSMVRAPEKFNHCDESNGKGPSLLLQYPYSTFSCKMCCRYCTCLK